MYFLFPAQSNAANSFNSLETCEKAYDAKYPGQNPPNGIKCVKRGGSGPPVYLFFNYKLYMDQKVIAYGTPEAANGPSDFRVGTWKDLEGNKRTDSTKDHPYFTKGGQNGEYRYYGWDVNGNLYTNPYFPDDANSGVDPSLKKYIYRPWSSRLLDGNRNKPQNFGQFWGRITKPDEIYAQGSQFVNRVNMIIKSDQVTVKYQAKDSVIDSVPSSGGNSAIETYT